MFPLCVERILGEPINLETYFKLKEGLRLVYHLGSGSDSEGLYWTYRNGNKAMFFVNGQRATYMNGLLGISMKRVQEIYHGDSSFRKKNSHLIFTTGEEFELPIELKTSKPFTVKNGYTFNKEVYKPLYINPESKIYKKIAAIAWSPKLICNKNGYSRMSFANPGKHDLLFIVEGFTEIGEPFSTITPYKLNKNKAMDIN